MMKILAVLNKEFMEHVRSSKLIFLIILIFGGIIMALYTEVGPTADSKNVIGPFFELFTVLCPLIAVLAAMDSITGEREKGALDLVLTKPVPRTSILLGKYINYILIIIPLLILELALAYYYAQWTGISTYRWNLPMPPLSEWLSMVTILTFVTMYYLALMIFISLFARSTATAGIIGVLLMAPSHPLGNEILNRFLMVLQISDISLAPLPLKFAMSIFAGYQRLAISSGSDFFICIISLLVMTLFLLFVSSKVFEKQDITFKA